jgi:hypothetical protein
MNLKYLRELRQFKKASQLRSWETYRALLGRLCQAHAQYDFVNTIQGLLRNQKINELIEYADSLSEQSYSDATLHFVANQFAALIRKYPFPSNLHTFDAKKTAKEKWLKAEELCSETNIRFSGPLPLLEEKLHKMRGFIAFILGQSPDLYRINRRCDFGPGASLGVHGNATNKARKIASRWSVSSKALNYAYGAVTSHWQLLEILLEKNASGIYCLDPQRFFRSFVDHIEYVQYNKIAFVPKTVKVERPIAVEPLLNGFVQKGIDLEMRRLLALSGLDLSDQTVNQRFARDGSIDDSDEGFVTIDLSSASDSISIEVVRNLIPPDWFYLLDNTRSTHYRDDKGVISRYHKFCSMGNGFCFPLETLLFAAACSACDSGHPGHDFVVYGDDIIVRKKYAGDVLDLLSQLGFRANMSKTFLAGPFRESCGSDWFGGEDVRPFTLDFELDSLDAHFKFLNLSERNARTTSFFAPVREFVISRIPPLLRFCRLHDGNADTGYRVGQDEFMTSPHTKWSKDLQCWSWLELVHLSVSDDWETLRNANYSHVYAALSGASSTAPFTIRRKTKTNVRRVAYG